MPYLLLTRRGTRFLLNQTSKEPLTRIVKEVQKHIKHTLKQCVRRKRGGDDASTGFLWRLNMMTSTPKPHPLRKWPEDQKTVRLYTVPDVSTCFLYSVMTCSLLRTHPLSQKLAFLTRTSAILSSVSNTRTHRILDSGYIMFQVFIWCEGVWVSGCIIHMTVYIRFKNEMQC